jgi:uncharacterized Ntn-hydrolase superfamily protein
MGIVTTQNVTNPALGPAGLALLRQGLGAGSVLDTLLPGDPGPEWRQVAVIDSYAQVAVRSGDRAFKESSVTFGTGFVAMGNLLSSPAVTEAMASAFENLRKADLADRLMRALEAGLEAGGETLPVHSAGIQICHGFDWPEVNLRVDWDDAPIARLREIWTRFRPQRNVFIAWAQQPWLASSDD